MAVASRSLLGFSEALIGRHAGVWISLLLCGSLTANGACSQSGKVDEAVSSAHPSSKSKGAQTGSTPEDSSSSQNKNPDTGSTESDSEPSVESKGNTTGAAGSDRIDIMQIKVGDRSFDARAAGPVMGEAVLLLHGFPETSLEWTEQLKSLGKAGFRAIAPDQRGYSPKARPSDIPAYATANLVADVLAMADELGIEQFHLVGHDWGAAVAWATAAKHPDRILSLTPISVPHPDAFQAELQDKSSCQYEASSYFDLFVQPNFEDTLLGFNAAGLRNLYEGLPSERIEAYVAVLGNKAALDSGLNWYRANIKDRQTVDPPTGVIKVPTAFIWSDQDKAICREGAENTKNFVDAHYRFHELKGVNHWVPELAPDQVSKILIEHIKAHGA